MLLEAKSTTAAPFQAVVSNTQQPSSCMQAAHSLFCFCLKAAFSGPLICGRWSPSCSTSSSSSSASSAARCLAAAAALEDLPVGGLAARLAAAASAACTLLAAAACCLDALCCLRSAEPKAAALRFCCAWCSSKDHSMPCLLHSSSILQQPQRGAHGRRHGVPARSEAWDHHCTTLTMHATAERSALDRLISPHPDPYRHDQQLQLTAHAS